MKPKVVQSKLIKARSAPDTGGQVRMFSLSPRFFCLFISAPLSLSSPCVSKQDRARSPYTSRGCVCTCECVRVLYTCVCVLRGELTLFCIPFLNVAITPPLLPSPSCLLPSSTQHSAGPVPGYIKCLFFRQKSFFTPPHPNPPLHSREGLLLLIPDQGGSLT